MKSGIFSIGHSVHPIERFVALLTQHGIKVVADVRSTPFSRFNPQFNRKRLDESLAEADIEYAFFGDELGARVDDPSCYVDGKVQYSRLAARPEFQGAIEQLVNRAGNQRVALMCAEKEPLDCHRTLLVAEAFRKLDLEVGHILADGSLEPHSATLKRLVKKTRLKADMLRNEDDALQQALAIQESKIAYQKEP